VDTPSGIEQDHLLVKPDRQFVAAVVEHSKMICRMRLQRARPWRSQGLTPPRDPALTHSVELNSQR
jgi:hypothetical protein